MPLRTASLARLLGSWVGPFWIFLGCAICVGAPGVSRAADVPVPSAPPIKTYSTVPFVGFDIRERSYYAYAGVVHAFNKNLAKDGFLFRAMGLYNPYSYASAVAVGGNIDGRMSAYDVLIGYQKISQSFVTRIYVGLDFEGHHLSPDNLSDTNRGNAYGVHVRGELETPYYSPYYGSLLASYGSAKDRYWVRGRAGYNFQGVILGPEAMATGNRESHEQRVGGFVTLRSAVPFELSMSAGYSNTNDVRGGASAYGTVELSYAF